MEELYKTNDAFHQYVDRYCVKHEIGLKTAFSHSVIINAAEYYKSAGKGKISVSDTCMEVKK